MTACLAPADAHVLSVRDCLDSSGVHVVAFVANEVALPSRLQVSVVSAIRALINHSISYADQMTMTVHALSLCTK